MAFDLKTVEALAPDQASLSAASKLTKRSHWVRLERNDAQGLIWGECQGSGANPYRAVADTGDHGSKCTCPSRKFPCKHALALMWIEATADQSFAAGETPEWVNDWLGRRRKGTGKPESGAESGKKSIIEAQTPQESAKTEDPAATQRREAAQRKRADTTQRSIAAGLDELDQWIADQLRLGLSGFIDASTERCRRIAARLVDAKAAALASRIDELPSRLIALRAEERPEAALRHLGKLVLLAKAWRAAPDNPDLWRMVATSETRDQLLANPDAPRVESLWEVLGEKIETRRDGLVSHATWLLDLKAMTPRFAVLQDYYPASAGKRLQAFSPGDRFVARLVFYPSSAPLRALVAERFADASATAEAWPDNEESRRDPLALHVARQHAAPWDTDSPLLLPLGMILRDEDDRPWWQAAEHAGGMALPLADAVPKAVFGLTLQATAGLWDGARLSLLAAQSPYGRLDLS